MKKLKESNSFKYDCKHVSRRCESYKMYLKGDSPHQTFMIVCECFFYSPISLFCMMRYLYLLAKVSHTSHNSLLLLIQLYRYNMLWPLQGIHVLVEAY